MDVTIFVVQRCMIRPSIRASLETHLDDYFQRVTERPPRQNHRVRVEFVGRRQRPTLTPADVIIYAVPNTQNSVFTQFTSPSGQSSGHGGLTLFNIRPRHQTASEIYDTVYNVLEIARDEGVPTYRAADRLAERRIADAAKAKGKHFHM